jgi:hypothetical protein
MPNAGNERRMALSFCPPDRFVLRLEGGEYVVRMILDNIVVDRVTLTASLRAGFNVDVRHDPSPLRLGQTAYKSGLKRIAQCQSAHS